MKYLLILVLFFSNKLIGQSYFRIGDSKHIFRYYNDAKKNTDKINDQFSVKIIKIDHEYFLLSIVDSSDNSLNSCLYMSTGKFETIQITSRVKNKGETKYIKNSIKVERLMPKDKNCIAEYLP